MKIIIIYAIIAVLLKCTYAKTIVVGVDKKDKPRALALAIVSLCFAAATISEILYFENENMNIAVLAAYVASYLAMTAFMTTFMACGTKSKICTTLSVISIITSLAIGIYTSMLITSTDNDFSMMYSNGETAQLTFTGVVGTTNALILFAHAINIINFLIISTIRNKHEIDKKKQSGDKVVIVAYSLTLICAFLYNYVFNVYRSVITWLEPMVFCACLVVIFASIINYETLKMSSLWKKYLTNILIAYVCATIYFVLLALINTILSKEGTDGAVTIFANIIILIIFAAITPLVFSIMRSATDKIIETSDDMGFVSREIILYAKKHKSISLDNFFEHIAKVTNISYLGAVIDRKLYGSSTLSISQSQIESIMKLGHGEEGYWQKCSAKLKKELNDIGIYEVAAIPADGGVIIAQLISGKSIADQKEHDNVKKRLNGIIEALSTSIQILS